MRHPRAGFTLIELLIVVVILGILAAVVISRYGATKEKAFVSAMKMDLHNLTTAQETYAAGREPAMYAPGLTDLVFNASAGVNITVLSADGSGWSASATHDNVSGVTCAVFYGDAAAVAPATIGGQVTCN